MKKLLVLSIILLVSSIGSAASMHLIAYPFETIQPENAVIQLHVHSEGKIAGVCYQLSFQSPDGFRTSSVMCNHACGYLPGIGFSQDQTEWIKECPWSVSLDAEGKWYFDVYGYFYDGTDVPSITLHSSAAYIVRSNDK